MNQVSSEPRVIDLDAYCALYGASLIEHTLDLGGVLVHRAHHPEYGSLMLVNTAGEKHAVLYLS